MTNLKKYSEEKTRLAAEYIEKIGYDPFEDYPEITTEEVRKTLLEYDAEVAIFSEGGLNDV